MARNKNVGRSALANAGLVIQSKPVIDKTEYGMRQTTLKFNLRNENYKTIDPKRGTPCPDFTAGDERTAATLAYLDFLGAQTSRFTPGGVAPGIGILEVLCQGAIFNVGVDLQGVVSGLITDPGTDYTTAPAVDFLPSGFQVTPAAAHSFLRRSSQRSFTAPGTGYAVGDIIAFDGGTYTSQHMERVTQVDGSGGIVAAVLHQYAQYTVAPANPITISAVTGGGTGATATTTWEVREIVVDTPGEYLLGPPPAVLLTGGGAPGRIATCSAVMGEVSSGNDLNFTEPFSPVTTVKDTLEFSIFQPATLTGTQLTARAASDFLPPDYPAVLHDSAYLGLYDALYGAAPGALPPIDGVSLNVGDRVLLTAGNALSGLYLVLSLGDAATSFYLARVPEMDASAEFNNTTFVNVAEGVSNSGAWQCTVSGSFTLDTDPVGFEKSTGVVSLALGKKVTLDYHAIELHFEYMSRYFQSSPRFIQVEYQRDAAGYIILDPLVTPQTKMKLEIDSLTAIEQSQITDGSGNVTITDGPPVSVTEAEILSSLKYVGTSAQFEQVPAGQYWHVTEQTTIKVQAIVPVGTVGG
jgi:hypothetical protein